MEMTAAMTAAQVKFRRLEREFRALAYLTAVILHFIALFTLPGLPEFPVPERVKPPVVVDIPPELDIPPPPPKISKPGNPVEVADPVPEEVTIPPTVLEPIVSIAPPRDMDDEVPYFTPRDTEPVLRKNSVVYPEYLRRLGIEGTVILWLRINKEGAVERVLVKESSGYPGLDDAAVRGYRSAVFIPAFTRDQPVLVWVQKKVIFQIMDGRN